MPELKTVDGSVVVDGSNLTIINDDGNEHQFDWEHAVTKIRTLSDERDGLRIRAENSEGERDELRSKYSSIENPKEALEALELKKNLDGAKLIEAGKVETIKAEAVEGYEQQIQDAKEANDLETAKLLEIIAARNGTIYKLDVKNRFKMCPFVLQKVAMDPEFAFDALGRHFVQQEDGSIIPYYDPDAETPKRVMSRTKTGEIAEFDEAIELIIDKHPKKSAILRSGNAKGSEIVGAYGRTGAGIVTSREDLGPTSDEPLNPVSRLQRARAADGTTN